MALIFSLFVSLPLQAQTIDGCIQLPTPYNSQNLRDLDRLSHFIRNTQLYPYHTFHCNGVSCSETEYEQMCFKRREAMKKKQDPNIFMVGNLD